jgi:dihydroxyacetone kinase-like protein
MVSRATSGTPRRPPLEYGGDALAWAAWLYYAESFTQNDVALALGVSRASVANYLAEARRRGLVKIEIAPHLLETVTESRALAERFGLDGAMITPAAEDSETLRRRLGAAAAVALVPLLGPDVTLGVSWGRTMLEMARALPERDLPTLRVMQVTGSFLAEAENSPEVCAARIAGRLGALCQNFHAPAVLSTPAVRDALLAEESLRRHGERVKRCDIVVFGVGPLNSPDVWAESGFLPKPAMRAYIDAGAVCELLGRFIGADGSEIAGPLTGRQIGMELADLKAIGMRLLAAGGKDRLPAIRAALAGGYATHFVTDSRTARRLMEEDAP